MAIDITFFWLADRHVTITRKRNMKCFQPDIWLKNFMQSYECADKNKPLTVNILQLCVFCNLSNQCALQPISNKHVMFNKDLPFPSEIMLMWFWTCCIFLVLLLRFLICCFSSFAVVFLDFILCFLIFAWVFDWLMCFATPYRVNGKWLILIFTWNGIYTSFYAAIFTIFMLPFQSLWTLALWAL